MVVANPRLEALITQLKTQFAPIFAGVTATDRAGFTSAEACLQADVLALGLQLSAFDNLAVKIEHNLLVELLSFLNESSNMPYAYVLQTLDNKVAATKLPCTNGKPWPEIASISMAKHWATGNPAREGSAKALIGTFSDIVNEFIIRDGILSGKELNLLKSFEQEFSL